MIVLQQDIETRDINLVIGEYGIALDEMQVYTIELKDDSTITLNVDELNEYKWAKHYDIKSHAFITGIIAELTVNNFLDNYLLKSFAIENDVSENNVKHSVPDEIRGIEFYIGQLKAIANHVKHEQDESGGHNNPLIKALKQKVPPDNKRVREQKSKTKTLLKTKKYGQFRDSVAKRLVDEYQDKYGPKGFIIEPRQAAYFIFNNNSFDGYATHIKQKTRK